MCLLILGTGMCIGLAYVHHSPAWALLGMGCLCALAWASIRKTWEG